jgi:hypothetical protein
MRLRWSVKFLVTSNRTDEEYCSDMKEVNEKIEKWKKNGRTEFWIFELREHRK